jgi:hypothetical protein
VTARLVLWRARPPFVKVVRVRRVTVAGFIDVLDRVWLRVREATVKNGGKAIAPEAVPLCFVYQDYCDFADAVCIEQRPGFFHRWQGRYPRLNQRNMEALLAASREAEGPGAWSRMFDLVRVRESGSAKQTRPSVGIPALVSALCLRYPQLDPGVVLEEWSMQRLIRVCSAEQPQQAAPPARADGARVITNVAFPNRIIPREQYAGLTMGRFVH